MAPSGIMSEPRHAAPAGGGGQTAAGEAAGWGGVGASRTGRSSLFHGRLTYNRRIGEGMHGPRRTGACLAQGGGGTVVTCHQLEQVADAFGGPTCHTIVLRPVATNRPPSSDTPVLWGRPLSVGPRDPWSGPSSQPSVGESRGGHNGPERNRCKRYEAGLPTLMRRMAGYPI